MPLPTWMKANISSDKCKQCVAWIAPGYSTQVPHPRQARARTPAQDPHKHPSSHAHTQTQTQTQTHTNFNTHTNINTNANDPTCGFTYAATKNCSSSVRASTPSRSPAGTANVQLALEGAKHGDTSPTARMELSLQGKKACGCRWGG